MAGGFDEIFPMTVYSYETTEMKGPNYVNIPLRSSSILKIEKHDKYCFLWSILPILLPCRFNQAIRVSIYGENLMK